MNKILLIGLILFIAGREIRAQTPSLDWGFGSDSRPYLNNVDIDGQGSLYLAATIYGTLDVDPGPASVILTPGGPRNGYICKFAPTGKLLWAKSYGGSGDLLFTNIDVDSTGNVFVAGNFSVAADIDPGAGQYNLSSAGWSTFIAKLDPQGFPVWCYTADQLVPAWNNTDWDRIKCVSADNNGNVNVTGEFFTNTEFDPSAVTQTLSTQGMSDIFILRLNPAGKLKWVRAIGTPTAERAGSIYGRDDGKIFILGQISGTTDIDPNCTTYTVGATGMFMMCLDSTSAFSWGTAPGGLSSAGNAITGLPNGNVIVAGDFSGLADFDPGPGTYTAQSGVANAFVLELSDTGGFVKFSAFNSSQGPSVATSAVSDLSGNIYACGMIWGPTDFDPGPGSYMISPVYSNGWQSFVCKLSPAGNLLWAGAIESSNYTHAFVIRVGPGGRIFSGGTYSDVTDLDPGPGAYTITSPMPAVPVSSGYFHSFCQAPPDTPQAISGRTLLCVGESASYSVSPAIGAMTYSWSVISCLSGSSDSTSISFNGHSACSGTVTVKALNGCGGSAVQSITFEVNDCTGIGENDEDGFQIFPNPSNAGFLLATPRRGTVWIRITDMQGRLVKECLFREDEERKFRIERPGLYFCKVSGAGFSKTVKVVAE